MISRGTLQKWRILAVVTTMVASSACGSAHPVDPPQEVSLTDQALRNLANQYLFDTSLDLEGIRNQLEYLANLSPLDSVRFFRFVRELNGYPAESVSSDPDSIGLAMDDLFNDLALQRNENRFRIPREVLTREVKENFGLEFEGRYANRQSEDPDSTVGVNTQALCFPGFATCTTSTFPSPQVSNEACGNGTCHVGAMYDRVSNDVCEPVACDFRISYAIGAGLTANRIYGLTAAARCATTAWATLLTRYDSPFTRVLYGYGNVWNCGASGGGGQYLMQNTGAWKK